MQSRASQHGLEPGPLCISHNTRPPDSPYRGRTSLVTRPSVRPSPICRNYPVSHMASAPRSTLSLPRSLTNSISPDGSSPTQPSPAQPSPAPPTQSVHPVQPPAQPSPAQPIRNVGLYTLTVELVPRTHPPSRSSIIQAPVSCNVRIQIRIQIQIRDTDTDPDTGYKNGIHKNGSTHKARNGINTTILFCRKTEPFYTTRTPYTPPPQRFGLLTN
jgi:hypothetical protein